MWDLPDEDSADNMFALRLTNVKVEDSGPYTCRVSNVFGSINFTYTLEVVGEQNFQCFTETCHSFMIDRETPTMKCEMNMEMEMYNPGGVTNLEFIQNGNLWASQQIQPGQQ